MHLNDGLFAWPERPAIGAEVQLNSGSDRWVIVRYEGEAAVLRQPNGDLIDLPWACLRPWRVH